MLTRKFARENAFILIFEKIFNNLTLDELMENAKEVRQFETDDYVNTVVSGVYENKDRIDSLISENAKGWKLDRISKVALALMRLSLYEILFMPDIPNNVSVSEAVILCKKYATEEDAAFLNGVLGTIVRDIMKEEK